MNYLLSESDIAVLRQLIDAHRNSLQQVNTQGRQGDQGVDHQEFLAPEVYIARTPVNGIPGLSGSVPGSATCSIYTLVSGSLAQVSTFQKVVNNLSGAAVPGSTYTAVHRDKFGNWIVGAPASMFVVNRVTGQAVLPSTVSISYGSYTDTGIQVAILHQFPQFYSSYFLIAQVTLEIAAGGADAQGYVRLWDATGGLLLGASAGAVVPAGTTAIQTVMVTALTGLPLTGDVIKVQAMLSDPGATGLVISGANNTSSLINFEL